MAGPDVEFLGWRPDEEVREYCQRASAVLLPGVEDFGMVPVEAQACGRPVVALGAGGALETVVDGETGVLADAATAEAFAAALTRVRAIRFDPQTIRAHALRFSRERFKQDFANAVEEAVAGHGADVRPGAAAARPADDGARGVPRSGRPDAREDQP
jgi:glycosyltransferase involved in cell wall biosynthesis